MKADETIVPGSLEGGVALYRRMVEQIAKCRTQSSEAWARGDFEDAWLNRASVEHVKRLMAKHVETMKRRFPGWEPPVVEEAIQ